MYEQRIALDPDILAGKPTVKGTRVPTELVLKQLSEDLDIDVLLEDYPRLSRDDIKACLEYAYRLVSGETLWPAPPNCRTRLTAAGEISLDESVNFPAAAYLAAQGHDILSIARDVPPSLTDRAVLAIAVRERRVLLTNDRDFGNLVFREALSHAGIVLFRLDRESRAVKLAWLAYVLARHAEDLAHFIVVSDRGVRIRRTEPT
jgi:uncharacterized protein (DUF433 family)/predicted nuclease of predicted toxin-antitoxin system